ncbi:hypothetical protein GALMADRAFT_234471 [Galerina marginata CBS 339.88]|uniref:Exocyst complex component EXO84 n=1 Tax=Galerina marginata (strain CBS 339.88) TaxID=685588 RepID=A0A067TZV8_GALM3|nr:hypothetical protein GALMADRAFT_234471 [Galerina marginata CBS 339.88]
MESSLRSRPSQAPRKAQRSPAKLAKPGAGPTPRDRSKNRIDDKIKKRMSTRYADISSPTQLTGLPPMPSLGFAPAGQGSATPGREGEEDLRDRTGTRDDAKAASDDKKLLNAEDFDPAAYLKLKLANSTEAELKSLQSSLRNAVSDTSSELQRSVFKNYAEFVLISKEISVLENEMLELKDLLSDYKSMPSTLHIPDPTSTSSSVLSTYKRSSVADLRVLYFSQMQTLHASIEGASKFVPTTPGRHVVGEMENVFGLNAATYKVTGKVKFVVLDDAVLVARRRRRNAGQGGDGSGSTVHEGKLVAEKCWPLNEMLVLDTKDSPSMTNVFKIRHGKETHVYRTETPSDKKSLLSQFRQVAEELSQKRRKEREGEHERRKSMWQGGPGSGGGGVGRNSPVPPVPDWMAELAKKGGDIPGLGTDAKEKAERDARWIGEWSDDLTVAIALKEWGKAVDLVEQGQAKVSVTPLLSTKLLQLTSQLITSLLSSLALPSSRKSTVISLISLLNRLKAGAAARNTFLEMRSQVIRGLMRKIRFEGHIGTYIGELAIVYFTGIKHTADWYLASFKENEVASSFISWTKHQLEDYCEIFRKQVYSKDVDPQVVEEAINITLSQSKKLLQEYGLDFRYLLDDRVLEKPKEPSKTTATFSFSEHRLSKEISSASFAKQVEQQSHPYLQPAPPMPTLSAAPPPINRRRSPAPAAQRSASPAPSASTNPDSLYPSSTGLNFPAVISPSIERFDSDVSNTTTPLFSSRQNPSNFPLSAMARARTPVSAVRQLQPSTPVSAPIPAVPLASPLPRPPMSATSYRTRELSGSFRAEDDRESADSYRDNRDRERDRPPRSARASPVPRSPIPPPPRSANRPGSSMGQRTPIAVAQREGMI